ncbi:protein kinase domain-containing protein [Niveibacterium microcysteis]|uniref:HAMP domain-containing protein n=1 Tax=Niveibacterium microcysteis TaxID=2811415 RepID=A0ABX7MAM7_9RHOO|nr:cache domain-containing protein [Niveibacterium microcysteis]QSI76532.1 HAMP domain-containing protein [Niveibacterium microcysteis]
MNYRSTRAATHRKPRREMDDQKTVLLTPEALAAERQRAIASSATVADDSTVLLPAGAAADALHAAGGSVPIALPAGYRLHEYRIDAVLGQGGFGITYLATDVNLHASVAIKEYLPAQFAHRARDSTVRPRRIDNVRTLLDGLDQFLVEARTLATFRHPNIVRVARFFEANRTAYMVLDYERGKSLTDWWQGRGRATPALSRLLGARKAGQGAEAGAPTISEPDLLLLLAPLLDGLALVHRSGVLHRDIKPDNISVRDEDGSLVLLDFGAARPASGSAVDAPAILTPGYAPIEQYLGDHQGPWTDLYAFAATLYWMVSGQRPREAPDRQAAPQADLSAETAGAGRFSPAFLRAIDWALQVRPEDRPQNVEVFRRALFAAHASSLGLQEALAAGGDATRPEERKRLRIDRWIWHPGAWPLAVKMSLALVFAALVPMSITGYHNYTGSMEALAQAERRSLEHLALSTAGRLSQLIEDSRRVTAFVANDQDVVATLENPNAAALERIRTRLAALVATNPDVHLLTLMDGAGTALISTAPEVVGGNYAFREYFKTAMSGRPNVTSLIVGAVAGRSGAYLAHPVRDPGGRVIGVIVLRIRAETIGAIVDSAHNASRNAFLIDGDGVLIHHRDPGLIFHSLDTLSPATQATIASDQRFRRRHIDSLGMPALARAMVGAQREGNIDYASSISKTAEVAGFAPVAGHNWVVGVSETHDSFEAPLRRMFRQVLYSLALVGVVFVLLALVFARSIVRPLHRLIDATHALKRGDYDAAHVRVTSGDEIGSLGRTFNVMIDVLRQRERERGLLRPKADSQN